MKPNHFILRVLAVFMLVSCEKNDRVSGKVTDLATGQPIQGIKVNIDAVNSGFTSDKRGLKRLNSGSTDANGVFSMPFKFKENKQSYFEIYIDESHMKMDAEAVRDEKYVFNSINFPEFVSSVASTNSPPRDINFRVAPAARIKLQNSYVNLNTVNITLYNNYFSLTLSGNSPDFYYIIGHYIQVPSDGRVFVKQDVPNIPTYYDTIYVEPFAKTTYTLHGQWQ